MKRLFITVAITSLTGAISAMSAERNPVEAIDTDAFTSDTQVTMKGAGDDHLAVAWWIPNEFWESILSRDASISESQTDAMLDALEGVSLLSVVQADISALGAFEFYTQEEISQNMVLFYSGADGEKKKLSQVETIDPDLELVLSVFKPILGGAMGNLGNNMHFYVLEDSGSSGKRLLDPYEEGKFEIQLSRKDSVIMEANIETPLNALFIPRKCPNGKDAHITWKFCPWTGTPLE